MAPAAAKPTRTIDASLLAPLAREVDTIATCLTELRAAINSLGVLDITNTKLTAAQKDINEVILHTRTATDTILETAETILAANQTGPAYRDLVEERMLAMMEACSFQDLTGQRLQRVSNTLNAMEERLSRFAIAVHARHGGAQAGEQEQRHQEWKTRNIVNGPKDSGAAGPGVVEQDDIDRLLAESF